MLYATDAVSLGDIRVSDSGYLEAFARTARTGVQQYLGAEVGRPDLGIVNVYRDANEVFSEDTLQSFRLIPITIDHPPGGVNAKNWRDRARGTTGTKVLRDGEYMRLDMKVKDADAAQAVKDGLCELSGGYRCNLVWGDGIAPDGTPYQARQVGITADHIAIVPKGRAGPLCRIGDSWDALTSGAPREPGSHDQRIPHQDRKVSMKTLTIDGHAVELSDAAIIAVSNLQSRLGTLTADNLKLTADLKAAGETASAKDGENLKLQADHKVALDAKDKEIADLKTRVLSADKLDAAVAERHAVFEAAKPILGDGFNVAGKTVADVRRAAVAKLLGDKAVEGKDDAHVTIAFDALAAAKVVSADPLRNALQDGAPRPSAHHAGGNVITLGDSTTEYRRMLDRDRNAWKMEA